MATLIAAPTEVLPLTPEALETSLSLHRLFATFGEETTDLEDMRAAAARHLDPRGGGERHQTDWEQSFSDAQLGALDAAARELRAVYRDSRL